MGSWAQGVEEVAEQGDRAPYLPYGTHDVEVLYGVSIKKRKPAGEILVKARVKILASNKEMCKPEDHFDMCINVQPGTPDNWKLQIADVRGIIAAAYACDFKEVGEAEILMAFPEQSRDSKKGDALSGKRLRAVATNIGKDGGDFTKYTCSPFDEEMHQKLKNTAPKPASA